MSNDKRKQNGNEQESPKPKRKTALERALEREADATFKRETIEHRERGIRMLKQAIEFARSGDYASAWSWSKRGTSVFEVMPAKQDPAPVIDVVEADA